MSDDTPWRIKPEDSAFVKAGKILDWHDNGDPVKDIADECEVLDVLRGLKENHDVIRELMRFIGYAECCGNKCRLPHCHSCSMEPEDVDEVLDRARKILKAK